MRRLNKVKRQANLENTMPYYSHNQQTVTSTKATTTTTKSSLSTRVRFKTDNDEDSGDNKSNDDVVTHVKPRQNISAAKFSSEPEKPRAKALSLKIPGLLLEIKDLTYLVEEVRTNMRLYKDKINAMQSIVHVVLI